MPAPHARLTLATGLVAALLTPVAPALAAEPPADEVTSSVARVSTDAWAAGRRTAGLRASAETAVAAYWTPARMRAATPETAGAGAETLPPAPVRLRGGARAGLAPVAPLAEGTATDPHFGPNHPTARTIGKVYYKNALGQDKVCSGVVVNSEGKNSVWTAGHCVYKYDDFHTNWMFAPAYDKDLDDTTPHGYWYAKELWTLKAWREDGNHSRDIGVAIVKQRDGRSIVDVLGGHGIRFDQDKEILVDSFGYPGEAPYDGRRLYRCHGVSSFRPGPDDHSGYVRIPCTMNEGSSGGPWLINYIGELGWVNAIISTGLEIDGVQYQQAAYFTTGAANLYAATREL